MAKVFFSLGSNLGERKANLLRAIGLLERASISVKLMSHIYRTEPVGPGQPYFYNACVMAVTSLNARDLLACVKSIESEMGRKKTAKWGPRIIDIDILFYNNIIISKENLKIPHPEIEKRRFVLTPLREIAPDLKHPESGMSVAEMLENPKPEGKARKLEFK